MAGVLRMPGDELDAEKQAPECVPHSYVQLLAISVSRVMYRLELFDVRITI